MHRTGITLSFLMALAPLHAISDFRFGACCSANGGVCSCKGGGAVCCDGKASTCACNEKDFHIPISPTPPSTKPTAAISILVPPEHAKYLPPRDLTPGHARSSEAAEICAPGYIQKVGRTTNTAKEKVFELYKIKRRSEFEIDHLISKGLGGSNELKNLYPQPHRGLWNVQKKDQLENIMHRMVCAGKLGLSQAQSEIQTDWIAAYGKYVGAVSKPGARSKPKVSGKLKKTKNKKP